MYGETVERLREDVRQLHARRIALADDLAAYGVGSEESAARDAFGRSVTEALTCYLVANALEQQANVRLEEARAQGGETSGLEAEAEETRREAQEVRERATARLLGDDVLSPLLTKLAKIY